jgi:hypothetical protein
MDTPGEGAIFGDLVGKLDGSTSSATTSAVVAGGIICID